MRASFKAISALSLLWAAAACTPQAPTVPHSLPLADADRDGIDDSHDACPASAEDDRGAGRDGCAVDAAKFVAKPAPAPAKPAIKKISQIVSSKVRVTEASIEIDEKIHFATGRAEIQPSSGGLLDQVAESLKAHLEIDFVEIAGHADVRGDARTNLELTIARAKAVRAALTTRGVDPKRLRAAGYGSHCPIDAGNNEQAWAKNRRVAFGILRRAGKDLQPAWGGCDAAAAAGLRALPIPGDAPKSTPVKKEVPKPAVIEKATPVVSQPPPPPQKQRCDDGDAVACLELGLLLEGGERVEVDLPGATAAFEKACDLKSFAACTKLGMRLMIDAKAEVKARGHFALACTAGDGAGCERLGALHEADDKAKALTFYQKACSAGDAPGCSAWGRLVVETDNSFGVALFDHACDRHWKPACALRDKWRVEAEVAVATPSVGVDVSAKANVTAKAKARAKVEVEVELPECTMATSEEACVTACEGKDARACRIAGVMRAYGSAEASAAIDLFTRAVALGDVRANVHWGLMLEGKAALDRFTIGCDADDQLACTHLGRLELKTDAPTARLRFETACDRGEPQGCFQLGRFWDKAGELDKARIAYDRGCEAGVVSACTGWGSVSVRVATTLEARIEGMAKLTWACENHNKLACKEKVRLSVCAFGDLDDCRAQCRGGDDGACATLGKFHVEGRFSAGLCP